MPYSYELIDKFIDFGDWSELINCYGMGKGIVISVNFLLDFSDN